MWAGLLYPLTVCAATALMVMARDYLLLTDVVAVYLLIIMIGSFRFGRGVSIAVAALSVAAYDFFFVPPIYRFAVSDSRHFLSFGLMFAVALTINSLATRIRRQERDARVREEHARTEEMRSSLLSSVSHDLRTPLATITAAASTLRSEEGPLTSGQRSEFLETICLESERMERLIENLLEMMRLESGGLQPKRDWVPLEEVVGSALTRLEPRLLGRELGLTLPEDLPLLSVDPVLFEQVLMNLLDNALKYTPATSSIEVRAQVRDHGVEVEVADRGPGLPFGNEAAVFAKFWRGSHPGVGGVGLGLSICRGIVEAHAGTITAETRPGGGALFRIILPVAAMQTAPVFVDSERALACQ